MKKNILYPIVLFLSLTAIFRCQKVICFSPPTPFSLRVVNAEMSDMLDPAVAPSLKLVYLDEQNANEVEIDFQLLDKTVEATGAKLYFLQSGDLPWKSEEGFKKFKLYRGTLPPDELTVNVQTESDKNCTFHTYEDVVFNGVDIKNSRDPSIGAYIAEIE